MRGVSFARAGVITSKNAIVIHGKKKKVSVPLARLVDWTADWVARGQPSLCKPTGYGKRDGEF